MLKTGMFVIVAAALALGGCATVSVIPGVEPVQEIVSIQQSELRVAAADFSEQATERGWIGRNRGAMEFARVLAHGNDALASEVTEDESYAALLGLGQREHASIVLSMSTDVNDAARLLSAMSQTALAFLAINPTERGAATRADLVSFERTLVQAQKARRTFAETLALIDEAVTTPVDDGIAKFDRQIDRARLIADRLAREYAGRNARAVS